MAELKVDVAVNVEKVVIHDMINEFAKAVFDKHGIRIDNLSIDWIDASGCGGIDMIVREVHLKTTSFQK